MAEHTPKVRRFEVWADCGHYTGEPVVVEFSDGETDAEIQEACEDACQTLIGNNFDTGWEEVAGG